MKPHKPILCTTLTILLLNACTTSAPPKSSRYDTGKAAKSTTRAQTEAIPGDADYLGLILQAEQQASGRQKMILEQARKMTLFERTIIKGGCWDYLDLAWSRAGVPRNERISVHQGSLRNGPYADAEQLRAGDWLYHVNYGYKNNEHSGMFIGWVDKNRRQALMLSYAGEGRKEPARYKIYDLRSVYNIIRAK